MGLTRPALHIRAADGLEERQIESVYIGRGHTFYPGPRAGAKQLAGLPWRPCDAFIFEMRGWRAKARRTSQRKTNCTILDPKCTITVQRHPIPQFEMRRGRMTERGGGIREGGAADESGEQ